MLLLIRLDYALHDWSVFFINNKVSESFYKGKCLKYIYITSESLIYRSSNIFRTFCI